ncbi:proteasome inhibitor-like protein [Actinidia rufa]|uniref:Proteasome inhibitor-like protein n=1 Tax=Actinidia rufa TaxID=165716 RepID=A0A7J0E9B5_9ERIC|nr:proteasome inhibitor-like protein [Actinidia rufa]
MVDDNAVMGVIRSSRPSFRNAHDKVAFAVHASFLASGYSLLATGPPAFANDALSSSSTDEVGIDNWNESGDDYAFLYSNSKKVLVKCLAMNDKLLVDALGDGDSKPLYLEIKVYIKLILTISVEDYVTEHDTDYSSKYKNFSKLVSIIDGEILSKLNGTSKESSSTLPSRAVGHPSSSRESPHPGLRLSVATMPCKFHFRTSSFEIHVDFCFSPELSSTTRDWEVTEPQRPQPYPSGFVYPPGGFPVGGSDLLPAPGAGMYPTRGDFGTGGGMLVGPDHPAFGWFGRRRDPGLPGGLPGVPPGARFDYYGPPDVPGFEPGRFARVLVAAVVLVAFNAVSRTEFKI